MPKTDHEVITELFMLSMKKLASGMVVEDEIFTSEDLAVWIKKAINAPDDIKRTIQFMYKSPRCTEAKKDTDCRPYMDDPQVVYCTNHPRGQIKFTDAYRPVMGDE